VRIKNEETPVVCRRNPLIINEIKAHPEYDIETSDDLGDEMHILWAEAALRLHLQDNCGREDEINALIAGLPRRKVESSQHFARSTGFGIVAES
jgi:hypothetical protein